MISGRKFAEHCNWNACPRYIDLPEFDYSIASHGDWVFLNGDYIRRFTSRILFTHVKKFNLIVHNMDTAFGEGQLGALLPHAIHIYSINTAIRHPKLTTIPIGFADRHLSFLNSRPIVSMPRDYEVYSNFKVYNNPIKRQQCLDAIANDARVVHKQNIPFEEYYSDLCRSKFVLCPEGTGVDTHRLYESILCGATPVVLRNGLSHLYEKLPVCIVDSWTDPYYEVKDKPFSTDVRSYL